MSLALQPSPFGWQGTLCLPSWLPLCAGATSSHVLLRAHGLAPTPHEAPSAAQLRAVDDLVTHEEVTFISVLHALRAHYDRVRPDYLRFFERLRGAFAVDPEVVMPALPDDSSFARLFQLDTIAVQPGAVDGVAYVHFYFSTEWEREHGIGVAVHRRRVLEVGYGSDLLQSTDYDVAGLEDITDAASS